MTARHPRFEIVRTDAGWHARFRASNGQVVWTTEVYTRRRTAERATDLLQPLWDPWLEVLEVDER